MSVPRHHSLLDVLVAGYDSFHEKLSRRLGSDMQARDALHNVYIRLNRGDAITADSPRAYLFRMALNAATDDMRSERRTSRLKDVDAMILDLPDNGADPLRAAAARQEVRLLEQALEELTPRRRTILLESRLHGRKLAHIAEKLNLSQRMVEIELKHAVSHCAERLSRPVVQRFGPQPRVAS